jgi:DNA topoisomerase-1
MQTVQRSQPVQKLLSVVGLRHVTPDDLTIRRRKRGKTWSYVGTSGRPLRDPHVIGRLKRLAVPPAYEDVYFAADPNAHLQAVGRDSAGRTQYRYHPDWEKVREIRKARRLIKLAALMPKVRAWVARRMRNPGLDREFAIAALIELVSVTALRPGSEVYADRHGTRGAATLLTSDVSISGNRVTLHFRGKGGKSIDKEFSSPRLVRAIKRLRRLPGRRLFQYRTPEGEIRSLRRRDVNAALREIAGRVVTLKDFRTLIASARALEQFAALAPKKSATGRRKQVMATMPMISPIRRRCAGAVTCMTPSSKPSRAAPCNALRAAPARPPAASGCW